LSLKYLYFYEDNYNTCFKCLVRVFVYSPMTEAYKTTDTYVYKKHLKNVGPIRHCEPPNAAVLHCHSPGVATVARGLRYRCPQQRRRQQRQRVTEGTAMAP